MRRNVRSASAWAGAAGELDPTGAVMPIKHVGQRSAGLHRLAKRADPARAELWNERNKDPRRGHSIAERRMPVGHVDAKPHGELFERETGKIGLGHLCE